MIHDLPIHWPEDRLVPAVIQDATSGEILMVGFMNADALAATRSTGFVHFWSRSRGRLWKKGETSGHTQQVHEIRVNCDLNSLLIEVHQAGAVCHDGYPTCYYRRLEPDNSLTAIRARWFEPEAVYGSKKGLPEVVRQWWGAYEFLKQHDLGTQSGTSRALRDTETSVVLRIADELRELAGVLDGSHAHSSREDDVVLEGSQVCYWVAAEAIRRGWTFDDVAPDRALREVTGDDVPGASSLGALLRETAAGITASTFTSARAHEVLMLVAAACAATRVSPRDIITADLEALRTRPYLAPWFERET
jgi:phosphoribosyl-AMP cyclohydrolase